MAEGTWVRKASPGQGQRGRYTEAGARPLGHMPEGGSLGREGLSSGRWLGSLRGQGYDTGGVLGDP